MLWKFLLGNAKSVVDFIFLVGFLILLAACGNLNPERQVGWENGERADSYDLTVALNGHHDPSGSPSYPTCLMIGNLGDLTIMEELSKVTILFHRYYTKYHLRFDSIIGQDSPGFANRFVPIHHAAPSDWIAEHPFTNVRPPRQSRPGTIPVKYPYPSPSYKE